MKYVIFRDDDTNATTPIECLEKAYRPWLERGLSVNLSVIPNVSTRTLLPNGQPEYYLFANHNKGKEELSIGSNPKLVSYLLQNKGYYLAQHGYRHDRFEFDSTNRQDIAARLDKGTQAFIESGLGKPETFVAPYDRLSKVSFEEAVKRFSIISTSWFEHGRLPFLWWPKYLYNKKILRKPHWKIHETLLLSHGPYFLSSKRSFKMILEQVEKELSSQTLTIFISHWWEYFQPEPVGSIQMDIIHRLADYFANRSDVKVVTFGDLLNQSIPLE
jgi:hypothetical protein